MKPKSHAKHREKDKAIAPTLHRSTPRPIRSAPVRKSTPGPLQDQNPGEAAGGWGGVGVWGLKQPYYAARN